VYSLEPADSERANLVRSFGAEYVSRATRRLSRPAWRIGTRDVVFEAVGTPRSRSAPWMPSRPMESHLERVPTRKSRSRSTSMASCVNIVLGNQVGFGPVTPLDPAFEASVRQLEQFMVLFPDALRGPHHGTGKAGRRAGRCSAKGAASSRSWRWPP